MAVIILISLRVAIKSRMGCCPKTPGKILNRIDLVMCESIALCYKLGVHVFDVWTLCPYLDKIFYL